jgi:spore coat protein U-like protein
MALGIRNCGFPLVLALVALPLETARAAPSCHGFSVTNVAFGTYDPITLTPLDSQGSISYNCPPPLTATVSINRGSSSTYQPRTMIQAGVTDALQYNLYLDAAHTTVWGDGTEGTSTLFLGSSPGGTQTIAIYARLFPNQDIPAGAYADSLIVTFFF